MPPNGCKLRIVSDLDHEQSSFNRGKFSGLLAADLYTACQFRREHERSLRSNQRRGINMAVDTVCGRLAAVKNPNQVKFARYFDIVHVKDGTSILDN